MSNTLREKLEILKVLLIEILQQICSLTAEASEDIATTMTCILDRNFFS
jgi:hypothetical protein